MDSYGFGALHIIFEHKILPSGTLLVTTYTRGGLDRAIPVARSKEHLRRYGSLSFILNLCGPSVVGVAIRELRVMA